MYLTREEEKMLKGEMGYAKQVAMEILVALGEIYGAEKMVKISSAQVSGVSYKNLGEAGVEWLEELSRDGRVEVYTTLNPAGMDIERWREMGVSREFAEQQIRIIEAYTRMGIHPTLTCTPYLAGNKPSLGDHIAWAESSAVVYANSVIGARTNREGGPSALASALTGRTPYYGLHITENRAYSVKINVPNLRDEYDFALLGYVSGKLSKEKIPLFSGVESADQVELKALGAAIASTGGIAMFHIEGLTPEYMLPPLDRVEEIDVEERDLRNAAEELNDDAEPDLIFIGCPHASLEELIVIMQRLQGRIVKKEMWVCVSRSMKELAKQLGVYQKLEELGVKIVSDTCPIVAPITRLGVKSIATNSAKGVWYSRNITKVKAKIARLTDLIEDAVK